jgi:hypothetical protein
MDLHPSSPDTADILCRIRGEFLEMPGLRLKQEQAERLWGLDRPTCRQVLEVLIATRFLCRLPDGTYGRLTDDPVRQAS